MSCIELATLSLDPFFIDEGVVTGHFVGEEGAADADAFEVGAGIGVAVFGELGEAEDEGVAGENLDALAFAFFADGDFDISADTSGDERAGDGDQGEHDGVGEVDGEPGCVVAADGIGAYRQKGMTRCTE